MAYSDVRIDLLINIAIALAVCLGVIIVSRVVEYAFKSRHKAIFKQVANIRQRIAFIYTKSKISIYVVMYLICIPVTSTQRVLVLLLNLTSCVIFIYLTVQVTNLLDSKADDITAAYAKIFEAKWLIGKEYAIILLIVVVEFVMSIILMIELGFNFLIDENK